MDRAAVAAIAVLEQTFRQIAAQRRVFDHQLSRAIVVDCTAAGAGGIVVEQAVTDQHGAGFNDQDGAAQTIGGIGQDRVVNQRLVAFETAIDDFERAAVLNRAAAFTISQIALKQHIIEPG